MPLRRPGTEKNLLGCIFELSLGTICHFWTIKHFTCPLLVTDGTALPEKRKKKEAEEEEEVEEEEEEEKV